MSDQAQAQFFTTFCYLDRPLARGYTLRMLDDVTVSAGVRGPG